MRRVLFLLSLTAFVVAPSVAEAANVSASSKAAIERQQAAAASRTIAQSRCSLCYTCGGSWPIFAGSFTAGETTGNETERAGTCGGDLVLITDDRPFLCCKGR